VRPQASELHRILYFVYQFFIVKEILSTEVNKKLQTIQKKSWKLSVHYVDNNIINVLKTIRKKLNDDIFIIAMLKFLLISVNKESYFITCKYFFINNVCFLK